MLNGWRGSDLIGESLPQLRLIGGVRLDAEQLEILAFRYDLVKPLRWIQGWSGATTVADLFDERWDDVLAWRNVGAGRREEILDFLCTLSQEAASIAHALGEVQSGRGESASDADAASAEAERQWHASVQLLGSWVATISPGGTWGDLVAMSSVPRPPEVQQAWRTFATVAIPLGTLAPAQDVLADYLDEMDDRRRVILMDRILSDDMRTLDEIGHDLGVTRERVRQLESATKLSLHRALEESEAWRPVRWAVDVYQERLGAIAPVSWLSEALPGMSELLLRLVTWLAGYRVEEGYLLAEGFQRPLIVDLPRLAPGSPVIDEFHLIETLLESKVKEELVAEFISAIDGVSRVDGQLVDWTGSQVDRALAVLHVRDEPQLVEDLFAIAGGHSLTSFRNRIFECDQIIRVTKNKVGLRVWGGTHYTSITDLMIQRLASGPMEIQELAQELERMYEVSANSVVMYAFAPAFKVSGDLVALRSRNDPFVPRNTPQAVKGLFQAGPTTLLWHVDVDNDILRGSGRSLPPEVGTFIGLSPTKEGFTLRNKHGDTPVSWLDTSITGPSIGSLRLYAEALGAREGDTLRLTFRAGSNKLKVHLVASPTTDESAPSAISRLTGVAIDRRHGPGALASAIHVSEDQLVQTLTKRKDTEVAEAAARLSRR